LPNHLPEVVDGSGHTALSGDVMVLAARDFPTDVIGIDII